MTDSPGMSDVRSEVERLRNATDEQLRSYDRERERKRLAWFHAQQLSVKSKDPLEEAYRVLLRKLEIQEDQAPVVRRDLKTLVFHSQNFCPTLEACKILGLETRRVCKLSNEKSTIALVQAVDPRLTFSRNYEKLRPYSEYCEESISYASDRFGMPDGLSAEGG